MTSQVLKVDGLVKRFGGLVATDHAQLQVRRGEIHALIGPNGAGKTTLIHQLSGALAPERGVIEFDGVDVTRLPMHERVARGLARSYQITSIFRRLSVLDNLALAVRPEREGTTHFLAPARKEQARYDNAAWVAEKIGLTPQLDRIAGSMSHGEQRQLEVGIALATSPQLLLLDEPMAGMGPDESERMIVFLQSLRGQTSILLVEHDMDAVFKLADTISTLVFGKVIATGTAQQIRNNSEVRRAYLGDELESQ